MLKLLLAASVALLSLLDLGCGIPEQTLRDEQLRSRRYRDAYESEHDENQALRARTDQLLTQLQQQEKKKCTASATTSSTPSSDLRNPAGSLSEPAR